MRVCRDGLWGFVIKTVEKWYGLLSQHIMEVDSTVFSRVDDSAKHKNMDEQEQDDNVFAEMLSFS